MLLPSQSDEGRATSIKEVRQALAGKEGGTLLEETHRELTLAGHDARVGLERSFEDAEKRGLAPAVTADEADSLAIIDP
jgi:hypothetical protein